MHGLINDKQVLYYLYLQYISEPVFLYIYLIKAAELIFSRLPFFFF